MDRIPIAFVTNWLFIEAVGGIIAMVLRERFFRNKEKSIAFY